MHTAQLRLRVQLLNVFFQTEADRQGVVYAIHHAFVKLPHFFQKTPFVYRTDLFKQDDAVPGKSEGTCRQLYMSRKTRLVDLRGDRGSDHCRTVTVSHVILNNKYGTNAALFAAHNGAEVGKINIAAFYISIQVIHAPPKFVYGIDCRTGFIFAVFVLI